jgi:hypothetical protein
MVATMYTHFLSPLRSDLIDNSSNNGKRLQACLITLPEAPCLGFTNETSYFDVRVRVRHPARPRPFLKSTDVAALAT